MSEEHKDKNSDRVKPLEVKSGGKEEGTTTLLKASGDDNKDIK